MSESVSDLLELAVLLKEVGLIDRDMKAMVNLVPLFETIDDLRACGGIMDDRASRTSISPASSRRAGTCRK